jgi:putative nucleotidyltransferase with HDIG domain
VRHVLDELTRVAVLCGPFFTGVATFVVLVRLLDHPSTVMSNVPWWLGLAAASTAVGYGSDRLIRRMTPLGALLKLTLVLPDRTSSRFRDARRPRRLNELERRVEARRNNLSKLDDQVAETIRSLVTALSAHDRRTRGHSERTAVYAEMLAREMRIPASDRERLQWAALLHDVGKLTVAAETLNATGRPEEADWLELLHHPEEGSELAAPIMPWLGEWGRAIVEHHERYDGSGYPKGLAGNEISLAARIVAVADAYEAMTAGRPYREPLSPRAAREEIAKGAGSAYDPRVCRALMNLSLGRTRRTLSILGLGERAAARTDVDQHTTKRSA